MSWHFSRALVEEFSAANYSAGEQFARLKKIHPHGTYWFPGKTTEPLPHSPFGMTYKHLTEKNGRDLLMWFLEGFRAKIYQSQAKGGVLKAKGAHCGAKWPESLAKFHLDSCSWKTRQSLLFEDSGECLGTWPRWGMVRGMEFWGANQSAVAPMGRGFGSSLMRPTASDGLRHVFRVESLIRHGHPDGNLSEQLARVHRLKLTPLASEILMGWPEMWTDCDAAATDNAQLWQLWHSEFYQKDSFNVRL